jgi:hypothetical protein
MADLTYLANSDPTGALNPFYALAKQYFAASDSTIVDAPQEGQTLEGILADLNSRGEIQQTINIVCQGTGFGALGMPITAADQTAGRAITVADDVLGALANKTLVPAGTDVVSEDMRVVIYGGDLGRSTNFLMLLSGLFGNPGELLAPRRLSVFTSDGSTVQYRQAQSWTLTSKAPLTPQGADAPAQGWPAYRTQFVADANQKFGPVALQAEAGGDTQLATILTAAADAATTASAATFFVESVIEISATATQTAKQVVDSIKPMSNGDPVGAAPQSAADVDDSFVVTTISGSDAYPTSDAQTAYSLGVVTLAQLIDQDVPIAEGPAYARVTSSQGLAPSLGPGAAGGGSGDSGSGNPLQPIIDALLSLGLPQDQIDELLADVPQIGPPEDVSPDSPDAEPNPAGPDSTMPQTDNP